MARLTCGIGMFVMAVMAFGGSADAALVQIDFGAASGSNGTTTVGGTMWNGLEPSGKNSGDRIYGARTDTFSDLLAYNGSATDIGAELFWTGAVRDWSAAWDLAAFDRDGDWHGIRSDNAGAVNTVTVTGLVPNGLHDITMYAIDKVDLRVNGGPVSVAERTGPRSVNDGVPTVFQDVLADANGEIAVDWGFITTDPPANTWASISAMTIESLDYPSYTKIQVDNPSFEEGVTAKVVTGFDATTDVDGNAVDIPGWQNAGAVPGDSGVNTRPGSYYAAYHGDWRVFLDVNDEGMFQTTDHVIEAGQDLTLSYFAMVAKGEEVEATLFYDDAGTRVPLGTIFAVHPDPDDLDPSIGWTAPWTEFSLDLAASEIDPAAFGNSLGIQFLPSGGGWPMVDMVSLGWRTAAVPEPSTWALALLGLIGLFVARRRRRA